jgi:hypothetical protein
VGTLIRPDRMRGSTFALGLIVLAWCSGCGAGRTDTPTSIVRDSAGVRIVESARAAWTAAELWQVAAEPLLRLGNVTGDPAYQFHQIRAIDVLRDGGVAVLDGGSAQLRRFAADGRHAWSAGSRGRGPGQFEVPVYLGHDSLGFFLWDRSLARLTVVGEDGTVLRSESFTSASGNPPIAHARFADGALLTTIPTTIRPPEPGTLLADSIQMWRFDPDTRNRLLLARLPSTVWLWTGQYQLPVPFTPNALRATAGTRLITASTVIPEIRVYASSGDLEARFVLTRAPVSVSPTDLDRTLGDWGRRRLYGAPSEVWAEWRDRLPVPELRPAFDRLFADAQGNIWARRFRIDADSSVVPSWDVLDSTGRYLGEVTTPRDLEIMVFGDRRLAGVARDSLDVEHVHVYRIQHGR